MAAKMNTTKRIDLTSGSRSKTVPNKSMPHGGGKGANGPNKSSQNTGGGGYGRASGVTKKAKGLLSGC